MKQLLIVFGIVAPILLFKSVSAQEKTDSTKSETEQRISDIENNIEGMDEAFIEVKSVVDILKKIKVSGYIQAQYQNAESDGISNFSGGTFEKDLHSRFMIRRGRIKFNYKEEYSEYTIQFDITEKGLATKDVYFKIREPWYEMIQLQAGVFDRPFGYEISYSSSKRESPERSRLFQSLFPGERDLGLAVSLKSEEGFFNTVNLTAGIFNGNGIAKETDNYKDFIGRLGIQIPFYETNMSIDFGASYYYGKVKVPAGKSLYKINSVINAEEIANVGSADRKYLGFDAQFYYASPFLGGLSLRGEYILGIQPGENGKNVSYTSAPGNDIYQRNFVGYYLLFIQNIGQKNQLLCKYDVYDPNTKISRNEIGMYENSKTGKGDLKYSTFGLGWIYHLDGNIKFTLYYEKVDNETSINLSDYYSDIMDDIFTFRIQYKF